MAIPNVPLPTPKQREMLCDMIHYAFVELRLLGWGGHGEQAADLADAFHNFSKEMYGWNGFSWEIVRGMLETYQRKWRGKTKVSGRDYVEMLDEIRRAVQPWRCFERPFRDPIDGWRFSRAQCALRLRARGRR